MKYLVMEHHLSYAVVLDEEGRFIKVVNRHYEVGQQVTEIIEMQIPQTSQQKKKTAKWIYTIAAMAACLILAITSVLQIRQIPYASVYMTINPEIRIDVNRNDIVVGLEGINADGKYLIEGYSYKKKDLDLVMNDLIDRAINMGFLHEGGQITLTLDADNDEWIVNHDDALSTHLNEYLSEKLSVTIEVTGNSTQNNHVIVQIDTSTGNYGEADYGNDSPHSEQPTPSVPADSNYDDGQTNYVSPYVSDSGYDEYDSDDTPNENISSSTSGNTSSDDNESNYASSNYDDSNDSQSDYDSSDSD